MGNVMPYKIQGDP